MDDIFGLSGKALQLSEDRSVLLTNNLVNSSTPNYKARDIDFHKVLLQQQTDTSVKMNGTNNPGDIPLQIAPSDDANVQYRVPMQHSLDGNTVDQELERKDFLQNALNYQVSLTFVQNKASEMMLALKGE